MADPNPTPPPSYPNAPPPPGYPQGTYPPAGAYPPAGTYPPSGTPAWQAPPPAAPYRGPMLPSWMTFGSILVVIGGVLILVGFIIDAAGIAAYVTATGTSAAQNYANSMETFAVLTGVGIFVAILGWFFHQMSVHR